MELTEGNINSTLKLIKAWECLPNFPKTIEGATALARAALKLAGDEDQRQWLIDKVTDSCDYSPTPIAMRRIFCQKFKPADGVEDNVMQAGS